MSQNKIVLTQSIHKEKKILLISNPYNTEITNLLKSTGKVRWSQTKRGWYLPWSEQVIAEIKKLFSAGYVLEFAEPDKEQSSPTANDKLIKEEVLQKVEKYKRWLQSRRYSLNTIYTYIDIIKVFLSFHHLKTAEEITNQDVIDFNNDYIIKKNLSASYQNQFVNSLKLLFRKIENRVIDPELIHRPRNAHRLPNILSKEEVKKLLASTRNIKHKAMLSITYACGLRCSEVLNLKPEHIDSKRGLLIIKNAKGFKDRIAPLSVKIVDLLRIYYQAYRPKVYLFEGMRIGERYDQRSLQQVIKQSVAKARINKPVTLHWLRHSYATHLLETGTDLRYIQEILGHKSSRTTEIYTHVSKKSIQNISSPFDDL